MFRKVIIALVGVAAISFAQALPAFGQSNETNGEVIKIDKAQGKVTLRHGPTKNLDMDQMTMVFRVKEPQMLDAIAVGDKIKFEADRVNGQITVTKIRK
jgi:Cu(I)/Ag(I) efflux system protein CusF